MDAGDCRRRNVGSWADEMEKAVASSPSLSSLGLSADDTKSLQLEILYLKAKLAALQHHHEDVGRIASTSTEPISKEMLSDKDGDSISSAREAGPELGVSASLDVLPLAAVKPFSGDLVAVGEEDDAFRDDTTVHTLAPVQTDGNGYVRTVASGEVNPILSSSGNAVDHVWSENAENGNIGQHAGSLVPSADILSASLSKQDIAYGKRVSPFAAKVRVNAVFGNGRGQTSASPSYLYSLTKNTLGNTHHAISGNNGNYTTDTIGNLFAENGKAAVPPKHCSAHPSIEDVLEDRSSTWTAGLRPAGNVGTFNLHYVEPDHHSDMVRVPRSIGREGAKVWESSMVGYFLDKKLPFSLVKHLAQKHWGKAGLTDTMATDNGFYVFVFSSKQDRDIVMEAGPWYFAGKPIFLTPWQLDLKLEKEKITRIPVWIKLYNIPWEYWNEDGLSVIASKIGRPLAVDTMTASHKRINYARVCVELEAKKKPINSFKLITFEDNPLFNGSDSDDIHIMVEYQWLPLHCDKCKCFGHNCHSVKLNPSKDNKMNSKNEWVQVKGKGKVIPPNSTPFNHDVAECSKAVENEELPLPSERPLMSSPPPPTAVSDHNINAMPDVSNLTPAPFGNAVDDSSLSSNTFAALQTIEEDPLDFEHESCGFAEDERRSMLTPRQKKKQRKKEKRAKAISLSFTPG